MMNLNDGESGHSFLAPDLIGNAFLLSVSFIATLHQLDKLPFYSLLMSFYWEWILDFVIFLWHLYR